MSEPSRLYPTPRTIDFRRGASDSDVAYMRSALYRGLKGDRALARGSRDFVRNDSAGGIT
jgi:hypothetical protein